MGAAPSGLVWFFVAIPGADAPGYHMPLLRSLPPWPSGDVARVILYAGWSYFSAWFGQAVCRLVIFRTAGTAVPTLVI